MHFQNNDCGPEEIVSKIQKMLKDAEKANELYPKTLKIVQKIEKVQSSGRNGWWGDNRDHKLCLSFKDTPNN